MPEEVKKRMQPGPGDPLCRTRPDDDFESWLLRNYKETPDGLEAKVLRIGTRTEYDKCMDWYRKRYNKELKAVRSYKQITIKEYMEDIRNGKQG